MDRIDALIIEQLQRNARAPYAEIGDTVGLSASAVGRRVERLTRDGVIRGFTVVLDPELVSSGTEAWVEVFCKGTVAPAVLERLLGAIPDVVEAGTVTGTADAVVKVRSNDVASLEAAIDRVRRAPLVDHTRSAIILSTLVRRPR